MLDNRDVFLITPIRKNTILINTFYSIFYLLLDFWCWYTFFFFYLHNKGNFFLLFAILGVKEVMCRVGNPRWRWMKWMCFFFLDEDGRTVGMCYAHIIHKQLLLHPTTYSLLYIYSSIPCFFTFKTKNYWRVFAFHGL